MKNPTDQARTEVKGWMEDDESSIQVNESVKFSTNVSYKDICEATIVIDILEKKVTKNRYMLDPISVMQHYAEKYQKDIVNSLHRWTLTLSDEERKIAADKIAEITEPDPNMESKDNEQETDKETQK